MINGDFNLVHYSLVVKIIYLELPTNGIGFIFHFNNSLPNCFFFYVYRIVFIQDSLPPNTNKKTEKFNTYKTRGRVGTIFFSYNYTKRIIYNQVWTLYECFTHKRNENHTNSR